VDLRIELEAYQYQQTLLWENSDAAFPGHPFSQAKDSGLAIFENEQ